MRINLEVNFLFKWEFGGDFEGILMNFSQHQILDPPLPPKLSTKIRVPPILCAPGPIFLSASLSKLNFVCASLSWQKLHV